MKSDEIFAQITDQIIASIEAGIDGGAWVKPWASVMPHNATTAKPYKGFNVLVLWSASFANSWSDEWATYKQWAAVGAQVRKGETGTGLIKWVPVKCRSHATQAECSSKCQGLMPVGFTVFNADQVDGYEAAAKPESFGNVEAAEEFFSAVGARVVEGGTSLACYSRSTDTISMPTRESFFSVEGFYGTLAHEHIHWTGAEPRMARSFGKRFGDDAYAVEELVAEIGSAFLCSLLGIEDSPVENHAQYLAHWLKVLRSDPKALYTAASQAQKAVDFMANLVAPEAEVVAA